METLEILILLVTASVLLVEVARRCNIPYPIVLICAGAIMSFIPGTQKIYFDPNIILLLVLPPILYYTAFWISNREFRKNLREIVSLALGLVIVTSIVVACLFKFFFPQYPWALAFVFGALIAPPDATAAKVILKRFSLSPKLSNILEGESLINDATGIVLYKLSLLALASGGFSPIHYGNEFFRSVLGGVGIGIVLGFAMQYLSRYFLGPVVAVVFSFTIPYVTYIAADHLGVSGVLAVVVNGLIGSHVVVTQGMSQRRILAFASWDILFVLLNCLIFVLIGVQLRQITERMNHAEVMTLTVYALIFTAAIIAIRFVWIFLYKKIYDGVSAFQEGTIMSWSGMRGIVSLALALALPYTIPAHGRSVILYLTFMIIFLTLVITGLTLPLVIKLLKVPFAANESPKLLEMHKRLKEVANQEIHGMNIHESQKRFLQSYFFTHHAMLEIASKHSFHKLEDARLHVLEVQKAFLIDVWRKEEIEDHELVILQRELDVEITRISRGEID